MDWHAVIERHGTALRRVVAVLVAMVGAGPGAAAGRRAAGESPPTRSTRS
jgi:hypothetical protein